MHVTRHIIHVHPDAPPKPATGTPCNGCGVCCLLEPCPLGVLLSGRRHGACGVLRWLAPAGPYRCGAISAPESVLVHVFPRLLAPAARWLAPGLASLARRWIAAGKGCDSLLALSPPDDPADPDKAAASSPTMVSPGFDDSGSLTSPLVTNCHDRPRPATSDLG